MGWFSVPWRGSVVASLKEAYGDCPWVAHNTVKRAGVAQVYAAVRFPDAVRAVVFLVELDQVSGADPLVMARMIHECEGPLYFGASRRVLAALDVVGDAAALAWRDKCRAVLSLPRLAVGSEVIFSPPITAGGVSISRAVCEGRGVFVSCGESPVHFRIGREFLAYLRESGRMGRVVA